jgi:hypothetical protein
MIGRDRHAHRIAGTLRDQGWNVAARRVPAEAYDGFYPGAREMRNMMQYWEAHTYFGPDAAKKIGLAREVATEPPTPFATWAKANLPAPT